VLRVRAVHRAVILEFADGMRCRGALAYQLEDLQIQVSMRARSV
jgi:hypothetical protein